RVSGYAHDFGESEDRCPEAGTSWQGSRGRDVGTVTLEWDVAVQEIVYRGLTGGGACRPFESQAGYVGHQHSRISSIEGHTNHPTIHPTIDLSGPEGGVVDAGASRHITAGGTTRHGYSMSLGAASIRPSRRE